MTIDWQIGDCIPLLKSIPDNSIDFMITDPPYGIGYVSNYYKHNDNPHGEIANDSFVDKQFNHEWLSEASRSIKQDSAIMVFTRWDVWQEWVNLISPYWNIKNTIVWVKNNWSAGDLTGNMGQQYELIIFATRGKFKIRGHRYTNVWNFNRVLPTRHPTEKPVALIQRGIELCTSKDEIVLDPFLGSGTTLAACRRSNRSCIGFEIEQKYEKYYADRAMTHTPDLFSYGADSKP